MSDNVLNVLMVGPGKGSPGGVLTVAENYKNGFDNSAEVKCDYVSIGTRGSIVYRCAYFLAGLFSCLGLLLIHRYDLCHIHMSDKGSVFRSGLVVLLAKLFRRKTIIHMHAGNLMLWFNTLSCRSKSIVARILNSADVFIVLGKTWEKEISEIVSPKKIVVIHNGVAVSDAPMKHDCNNVSFLYLGVIKKQKGLRELIQAIYEIEQAAKPNVEYIIAGTEFDMCINDEIEKWNLSSRIKYVGWADDELKEKLFSNASVCVLPSYYEGLPMSVLESMSKGLPNIVTSVGAIEEVVVDHYNGLIIASKSTTSLRDAMMEIINSPDLAKQLGNNAFSTIESKFSLELQLKKTVDVYKRLLANGRLKDA